MPTMSFRTQWFWLIFLGLLVILSSCAPVPENAYKVRDLGKGWYQFCLDGKRYMFHEYTAYKNHGESMARVPEDDGMCK